MNHDVHIIKNSDHVTFGEQLATALDEGFDIEYLDRTQMVFTAILVRRNSEPLLPYYH